MFVAGGGAGLGFSCAVLQAVPPGSVSPPRHTKRRAAGGLPRLAKGGGLVTSWRVAFWTKNRIKNGVGLLLAPLVAYGILRWFEYRQVFQPYRAFAAEGDELGAAWQEVWLKTSDGVRLNAWHFRASNAPLAEQEVFLICHGNGGNISHRLGLYGVLLDLGRDVLAFDYRGYGRSDGKPSEKGTYLDAQAAFGWLRQQGYRAEQILLLGESLGGGVATELATRETSGGLILQSTFTSIPDLAAGLYPWLPARTLATIRYDNLAKLPGIRVPLLVLHSRADTLIPFAHGQRLFQAANAPKLLREVHGDHNDTLDADREAYSAAVQAFLDLRGRPAAEWPTSPINL